MSFGIYFIRDWLNCTRSGDRAAAMGNQGSVEGAGTETRGPIEDEPMPLKDEVDRRFEDLVVSFSAYCTHRIVCYCCLVKVVSFYVLHGL